MKLKKPDWSQWDKAIKTARWYVHKRCKNHPMYLAEGEDLSRDLAIKMLTDGWNPEWRLADIMRERYGRNTYPSRVNGHVVDVSDNSNSPEFMTYLSERMSGKPLMECKKKNDYSITQSFGEFFRRWG